MIVLEILFTIFLSELLGNVLIRGIFGEMLMCEHKQDCLARIDRAWLQGDYFKLNVVNTVNSRILVHALKLLGLELNDTFFIKNRPIIIA